MANQELKIWSEDVKNDPIAGNQQRRLITDEEFLDGWLRLTGVSYQQLNQLFYLLTNYAAPVDTAPYLHFSSISVPDSALEMNGQAITEVDNPILYTYYGGTLPDITASAPAGFTYIVRNH